MWYSRCVVITTSEFFPKKASKLFRHGTFANKHDAHNTAITLENVQIKNAGELVIFK